MKSIVTLSLMVLVLSACHFNETLKEVGDNVETGVQNVGAAIKTVPADVGEALNKVEADLRTDR